MSTVCTGFCLEAGIFLIAIHLEPSYQANNKRTCYIKTEALLFLRFSRFFRYFSCFCTKVSKCKNVLCKLYTFPQLHAYYIHSKAIFVYTRLTHIYRKYDIH